MRIIRNRFDQVLISDSYELFLDRDSRVVVKNTDRNTVYHVCPSYGLFVHIHNDTLASLLCQRLKLGNVGIATDLPTNPGNEMLGWIHIADSLDYYKVDYGDVVTDNCKGYNRSLAISCAGGNPLFNNKGVGPQL